MNMVYVRLAAYFLAPVLAATGLGSIDTDAMTLTIDLERAALAVTAGGVSVAAIFAKWGKK